MIALQTVIEHWPHVAPLLTMPTTEAEYDALTRILDQVVDQVGEDEAHPLAGLALRIGEVVIAYDEHHRPIPEATGAEALRYLLSEHGLTQSDLPEIGTQSVVSEILGGKRFLNVRQIVALSDRFVLPEAVFIDRHRREDRTVEHPKSKRPVTKHTVVKRRKKVVRYAPTQGRESA